MHMDMGADSMGADRCGCSCKWWKGLRLQFNWVQLKSMVGMGWVQMSGFTSDFGGVFLGQMYVGANDWGCN